MEHIDSYIPYDITSYSLAKSEPARIVVIDDETFLTALLAITLREEGYEVQVAYEGRRGLELIKLTRPQLVISDIMLPIMSGLDLVSAMKTTPGLASIPVILMSAGLRPARLGLDNHFKDVTYLPKPFDLQRLVELVAQKLAVSQTV
jgi:DNA-binding NtrC family response regulator